MDDRTIMWFTFEKPGFDFAPLLQGRQPVELITHNDREFTVVMPKDHDLRSQIMEASIKAGNPIDLMQRDQRTLEDIFRSLTGDSDPAKQHTHSPNPQRSKES